MRKNAWVWGLALTLVLAAAPAARGQQTMAEVESVFASYAAALQSTKNRTETLETLGLHGFSVALVLGEMVGTGTPDAVPAGAKKALADMRDFLPYKSYKLIDAQWLRCCGATSAPMTTVNGRLRGPATEDYSFSIGVWVTGTQLSIHFSLRDATFLPVVKTDDVSPAKGKAMIDSTFSMSVGETVVIGTSTLKGDKAVIALLTAASRPVPTNKTQR